MIKAQTMYMTDSHRNAKLTEQHSNLLFGNLI